MDNDSIAIVEDAVADADKKEIERVLQEGVDALADALRGIDEETARRRPRPDAWSVLDCVEHIALTEAALFTRLGEAKPSETSREDLAREARFRELALNRARRIDAPDLVAPGRSSQTMAEARDAFHAARNQTMGYVRDFEGDLRSWLTTHPLITRPVNCYEMLLLMAFHPTRHAQQIVEIREQLSPPRSQM
jgi:hypothetical protein